ncbi:MAG TPA: hypothetical protein VFN87_08910 [Solirubrobacteraceae bacterium]|nr:hypothetical protein [Solirubrobacteraceae bacterium]
MSSPIKPLLVTLAVTGALAGGGAAIASAATSSSSGTSSSAPSSGAHHSAAPRPGEMPGGNARPGSDHNCPNM